MRPPSVYRHVKKRNVAELDGIRSYSEILRVILSSKSYQTHNIRSVFRYATNLILGKPLYMSVETTQRCNADCDFCEYRRSLHNEGLATEAASYTRIIKHLNPVFVNFAGGEPLIRRDLERIVTETKENAHVPIVSVTTNGILLTTRRYRSLSAAGLDYLNISLDYPDERHDQSRGVPGLFKKVSDFLFAVQEEDGAIITLNALFTKESAESVFRMLDFARERSVRVSLLPYTPARANNTSHEIPFAQANAIIDRLIKERAVIGTPLWNSKEYFENIKLHLTEKLATPCDAGRSFLWVTSDAGIRACNIIPTAKRIDTADIAAALKAARQFTRTNSCQECYLPCRAETEAYVPKFLRRAKLARAEQKEAVFRIIQQ